MCKNLLNFAAHFLKQRTIIRKDNENRFSIFNHFTGSNGSPQEYCRELQFFFFQFHFANGQTQIFPMALFQYLSFT